jgi:hypothetical protein
VYNQLSNNGNLAIYLSIASNDREATNYSLLFSCSFPGPTDIYASRDANTNVICFIFLRFRHGKNLHFMVRFNFFCCYFRRTCAKCTCGYFGKVLFDGMPHVESVFFHPALFSVEKEQRKRAYAMPTNAKEAQKITSRFNTLQRRRAIAKAEAIIAGMYAWEKQYLWEQLGLIASI